MAQPTPNKSTTQAKASSLRLLILTQSTDTKTSASPLPAFLQRLTGALPSADLNTFAGYTSHPPLHLKTRYYEAEVSIWCDELPSNTSQTTASTRSKINDSAAPLSRTPDEPAPVLSEWSEQMLSESAKEVRDVIGGLVLLLPFTQSQSKLDSWLPYMEAVAALRDAIEDESGREVASLVALQNMNTAATASTIDAKAEISLLELVEEEYLTKHGILGWNYVLWNPSTDPPTATGTGQAQSMQFQQRNEHGEATGFPRVLEVLESIDWTAGPSSTDPDGTNSDVDDILGTDPTDFLNNNDAEGGSGGETKYNYSDATRTALSNLQSMGSRGGGGKETESLLQSEQRDFQREMLGLRMAMMDASIGPEESSTSSLAGELDASDIGLRTPMAFTNRPSSKLSRTVSATSTATGAGSVAAKQDGGDEMQVEQLTGLMERIVAMREAAGSMGESERERFARREVAKIMKELN